MKGLRRALNVRTGRTVRKQGFKNDYSFAITISFDRLEICSKKEGCQQPYCWGNSDYPIQEHGISD